MFIFSRSDEKNNDIYNFNLIQYKNDPTLPHTKKYVCINNDCVTHKEPNLKEAVYYRQVGSYTVKYICKVCDSFWNTFIEK
jgi:aspartate carbamoyltransferase regulatory subunit